MSVIVDTSSIVLTGTVGDLFWDDSFSAAEVSVALAQIGHANPVTIRLNSGGGDAAEGAAIHAAIARHAGRTTIVVEGIAASAASLVAMAGDEIVMAPGSIMMIHDPATFTFGTAADHQVTVNYLTAQAVTMAGVYGARSGRTVDQARADMVAETWFDPEAAVAAGYADRVGEAPAEGGAAEIIDLPLREPPAFAYAQYRNAPERLRALAATKGWGPPRRSQAASAVVPNRQEIPMTNTPTGGADPAPATPATPAATATTPAPAGNVVDIATARSTARAEALAYAREVGDLCELAGQPERAVAFIAADTPVDEVRKALIDKKAEASKTPTPNTTQPAPGARRFDLAGAMRRRFGQKEA